MGELRAVRPVLRMLIVFSRHPEALDWARRKAEAQWGAVQLASPRFVFDQTDYYDASMGRGLLKQLLALESLTDPGQLAFDKNLTNAWEEEYAAGGRHAEPRPVNLDPGYLTQAKLVLATTKDRDHRIYLRDGIFAEVTLHYRHGTWRTFPWTYPDYATAGYHEFLEECRGYLRSRFRSEFAS